MSKDAPTQQAIAEALLEFLRSSILAEGVAVDEATSLSQLGVDSVSLVELLLFIERRFKVIVPDGELTAANLATIQALSVLVQRIAASDAAAHPSGNGEPKE